MHSSSILRSTTLLQRCGCSSLRQLVAASRRSLTTSTSSRTAGGTAVPSCSAQPNSSKKKRVVFLGTPEVAAIVLQELLEAAKQESASFEVAAVVSQPGKPKGRGNKAVPVPTPVEQLARQQLPESVPILCPKSAKEPSFLEAFAALQPDLAVTAAYGNMLPSAFLSIPTHGTLNIHPSLLPLYRGAAPVQRAVQDGVSTTGVSVAFTVLACDAGPIFLQETVAVPEGEQAPELLQRLFKQGAQLLVHNIDRVWTGEAAQVAWQQDHTQAMHAAKITKEESRLDFSKPAAVLHNQVRGFAGWPGAFATFKVSTGTSTSTSSSGDAGSQQPQPQSQELQVKILESRRVPQQEAASLLQQAAPGHVVFVEQGKRMLVPCGDGAALEVLQLQPPTKKAMQPKAFFNGLGGKQLSVELSIEPCCV